MARLSIDIGVNLGEATGQLGKLNSALISLNQNANQLVSTLKQIGKINIKPTVGMSTGSVATPQATPKQVPNVFEQYIQGASSASNITDLLEAKLEQLVDRSNELKQTLAGGIGFMTPSSSLEELKQVENQIKNVQGLLKSQSFNIVAPKNVPDIFKDFRSGASGAATAIDFLRQREQELINQSNALKSSLSTSVSAGGFQQTVRDIKQVEDELKKVKNLLAVQPPDVFADYRSGAIQASTALEFLEKKQAELLFTSSKLKDELGKAVGADQYQKLQNELNKTEKEINDVTKAINAQKGPIGGAVGAYGNLTKATNLANLSVVNIGRVFQDLPFGILGIANNLNPLVEGLKQLKDEAKEAGTSVGKQLLTSLSGFGGVTLAISAASAALSFLSVGLTYWSKNTKEAKENTDEFKEANKRLKEEEEQLKRQIDATNESISARSKITNYLKEITLTAAEAAGKSKEELRKLEDVLFKGEQNLRTTADAFGNIQIVPSGLIAQAAQDREDAARQYVNAFSKIMMGLGATYDEIRTFERNYYNDAVSGFAKYSKNLNASQRQQIDILRKNYSDRQKAFEDINQKYNQIVANRALEDKKESDNLRKKAERAKTVEDIYKEINDDLVKIQSRRDLDPLEKTTESVKRLKQGLNDVLDLDIKQLDTSQFKELENRLKGLQSIEVRLEVEKIKTDLDNSLKRLDEKGRILKINVSKDKINDAEKALNELYERYDREDISVIDKEKILSDIIILQGRLSQLNLDAILSTGIDAFKGLDKEIEKLKAKSILLKVSTNKEQLDETKRTIDSLLNARIELFSNGDITRGLILIPLLQKLQAEFTKVQAAVNKDKLGELFRNYRLDINKITEESKLSEAFANLLDTTPVDIKINDLKEKISRGLSTLKASLAVTKGKENIFSLFIRNQLKGFDKELREAIEAKGIQDAFQSLAENIQNTFIDQFANVFSALGEIAGGEDAGEAFAGVLAGLTEGLGRALLQFAKDSAKVKAVIDKIKELLPTTAGWGAIAAAAALGGLLIAASKLTMKGFAEGGFVSGPGSDRSDSIPARLSNGEFVVKARSVRKYGRGFMEMLNNGNIPVSNYKKNFTNLRFADGGIVSRAMAGNAMMPDLGLNNANGFIAETKISGQDLRLVLKRADSRYSNVT